MKGLDKKIKKKIIDRLYADDRLDATKINVEVEGSRVTFNGQVETDIARQLVSEIALEIENIKSVDNRLDIRFATAQPAEVKFNSQHDLGRDHPSLFDISDRIGSRPSTFVADSIIADSVRVALDRSMYVDADMIDVKVLDGMVVLRGEVANMMAVKAALEIAMYTEGVLNVRNNLIINTDQ